MSFIIGSGVAIFTIYAAAKWNKTDKEKIDHVFKNLNYGVGDKYPRLIRRHKTDTATTYSYHVPFGLVDDDKLQVISQTLNKPTDISFANGKLHIKVFNHHIPTHIDYDWQPTDGWTVPIGHTQDKQKLHDFDKIPHMTIAGMTRQGKTVLLKLIMAHLIHNHPNDAEISIIDLKGGLEFGRYERLKQVKSVASNVKEAHKALASVLKQIKTDMSYFKQNGHTNVLDTNIKARKFIIVDEGAELMPPSHLEKDEKKSYKYCQQALSEIARIGGALGYRLIFATQYPTSDTLPREIKQNSDAKISLRLPTEVASRVAIDERGAEQLKHVGRAIYRTSDKKTLQVPYINDKDIWERIGVYATDRKEKPETGTDHVQFG